MKSSKPTPDANAFSLVEVTMALGVISFCLIALLGLLPIGLKSNQTAVEQTTANGIFSTVIADLRATPSLSGTTQQFLIPIPSNPATSGTSKLYFTGDGLMTSSQAQARYLLTVSFVTNSPTSSTATSRTASLANLQLTWPAAVDPTQLQPNGSAQTFVALDRN